MDAVICDTCFEEIDNLFSKHGIVLSIEEMQRECIRNGDYECIACKTQLEEGEIHYETDFSEEILTIAVEELAEMLSQDIDACFNCEGNEIDYIFYKWNKDADEDEYREKEIGSTIEEYLYNQDIPELLHKEVTKNLRCQKCNYGRHAYHPKHNPDGGIFSLDEEVYTQKEIDEFWGLDFEEFSDFALQYEINLSLTELSDFKKYMIENPLLAFKHPAGQKIYSVLKGHFDTGDCIHLEKGVTLYRGRNRKVDATKLTSDQLWSPPKGSSSHGRYNLIGTSVLYCSDKLHGIPLEIHPAHDEKVDIGIFEIKKDLKLLNIDFFENFSGFFSEKDVDTKTLKEVYLLPNFIRDCCFEIGYHGVRYKGVHEEVEYTNYAFFNYHANTDIKVKKIYTLDMKIKYLVDDED
jgi:hypothetical protein